MAGYLLLILVKRKMKPVLPTSSNLQVMRNAVRYAG
jgi:hypothetical protein